MTVKNLLNFFENYYGGKYSGVFLEVMLEYFNGYPENFLGATVAVIIKRYSNTYGKLPDVAIIEKNLDEIYQETDKLNQKNYLPEQLPERCDEETASAIIQEMKARFKNLRPGPMASSLEKVLAETR